MLLVKGNFPSVFRGRTVNELAELCEASGLPSELLRVTASPATNRDPVFAAVNCTVARFGASIDKHTKRVDRVNNCRVWRIKVPEFGRTPITIRYYEASNRWDVSPNIEAIEQSLLEGEVLADDAASAYSAERMAETVLTWAAGVKLGTEVYAFMPSTTEGKEACKVILALLQWNNQAWWSAVVDLPKSGTTLTREVAFCIDEKVRELEVLNKHYTGKPTIGFKMRLGYSDLIEAVTNYLTFWEKAPVLTPQVVQRAQKGLVQARENIRKLKEHGRLVS